MSPNDVILLDDVTDGVCAISPNQRTDCGGFDPSVDNKSANNSYALDALLTALGHAFGTHITCDNDKVVVRMEPNILKKSQGRSYMEVACYNIDREKYEENVAAAKKQREEFEELGRRLREDSPKGVSASSLADYREEIQRKLDQHPCQPHNRDKRIYPWTGFDKKSIEQYVDYLVKEECKATLHKIKEALKNGGISCKISGLQLTLLGKPEELTEKLSSLMDVHKKDILGQYRVDGFVVMKPDGKPLDAAQARGEIDRRRSLLTEGLAKLDSIAQGIGLGTSPTATTSWSDKVTLGSGVRMPTNGFQVKGYGV